MSYRFASLSAGLLARKGAAQPAMATTFGGDPRPEFDLEPAHPHRHPAPELMRAAPAAPLPPPPVRREEPAALRPVPRPALAPAFERPRVVAVSAAPAPAPGPEPQLAPAEPCGVAAGCGASEAAPVDPSRRFHVSVRLKQSHFVRLKIAAATLRKPSQDIVGEALSLYFKTLNPDMFGDCACAREG